MPFWIFSFLFIVSQSHFIHLACLSCSIIPHLPTRSCSIISFFFLLSLDHCLRLPTLTCFTFPGLPPTIYFLPFFFHSLFDIFLCLPYLSYFILSHIPTTLCIVLPCKTYLWFAMLSHTISPHKLVNLAHSLVIIHLHDHEAPKHPRFILDAIMVYASFLF
jgi:hypothetical protein